MRIQRIAANPNMAEVEIDVRLKPRLEMCFQVVKEYTKLLDSYVLDFFTENHLASLPQSWKLLLQNTPLHEFVYLLNSSNNFSNHVWPLSIICLKALLQLLSLQRKNKQGNAPCTTNIFTSNKIPESPTNKNLIKNESLLKHPKLQNLFLKHVKPKKRYEIFKMAEMTAEVAEKLGVDCVVDVGSGVGHLSRIMAYGFNLNVCSIETQPSLSKQAEKLDSELEVTASKYLNPDDLQKIKCKRPLYVNQTIRFDLTPDEFLKHLNSNLTTEETDFKFGIVGLHPCGDLASVLLKLYNDCQQAKFINLVGCCYHKLTTSSDSETTIGFPLTQFCAEKCINISYEARALACHAIETYCERLREKNYHQLKIHCFRATLEKLIGKNWPKLRKSALGNVKSDPGLDFDKYCRIALEKLKVKIPEEDLVSEETLSCLSQWEHVVKFYSLRLMLAPLVETIILLDRQLFLLEKGFECKIVAAFDPSVSPRNQLLMSQKH